MTRALLVDLDDTLYDYVPAEQRARKAALAAVARDLARPGDEVEQLYEEARARVKERIQGRGAAHARLLYFLELAHAAGPGHLARVAGWDRLFWASYLEGAPLRSGAQALLQGFKARGGKVAIVTDLVVDVQLAKLEALGLYDMIDAIVVSEEVPADKPASAIFELAMERLGVTKGECVMVGDSDSKDGAGARALGIPFYLARSSAAPGGLSLEEIARALGVG